MLESTLCLIMALTLDRVLGEPSRFHPLIGYGSLIQRIETIAYRPRILSGLLATVTAILPVMLVAYWLFHQLSGPAHWLLSIVTAYLCVGHQSLRQHAYQVRDQLRTGNLVKARLFTGFLVSRDTQSCNESELSKATCESVLENGSDATLAPLFWFLVAGPLGILLYRMSNTLDASWGYRNDRYERFGKVAARLDDLLNWVPARLTSLSYALLGHTRRALHCWRSQGLGWKSPNAGPVMASGAGALDLLLGGPATYDGKVQHRSTLGEGDAPDSESISRCMNLVDRAVILWLVIALSLGGVLHVAT